MGESPGDEDTVTAVDIVQEQTRLEQEAHEVLPGKFETCTFSKGYIRQPVYACKTCSSDDQCAGLCYSCSIACHADHEVLELFPKREFRCDCGVKDKLSGHPCELESKGDAVNDNRYNHNFFGRYCRCDQLYDPEAFDGDMYQCFVCEDWFHDHCIGKIPPSVADFEHYVCRTCTRRYPFLVIDNPRCRIGLSRGTDPIHQWRHLGDNQDVAAGTKRKREDTLDHGSNKRQSTTQDSQPTCKQVELTDDDVQVELFLCPGWRDELCTCSKCNGAFEKHGVAFLLEDEVTFEPEEDEDAGKSLFQVGMEQLLKMDRSRAIDSAIAYHALSTKIRQFLQGFKDIGKIVTEKDIRRFFDDMNSDSKKP